MPRSVFCVLVCSVLFMGLVLTRNIGPVGASKPLAPRGVHSMEVYESRIGEGGLLIEDYNVQLWVPVRYENHSRIIFDYLVAGYENLSSIFGDHDFSYKFSVEHYPPGSPYFLGGTYAEGTIRYGYSNLEDDTTEWNVYHVPHMRGYYEEMAHCFVADFGIIGEVSVGFYETLGWMLGSEVTLRAANNPYIENLIQNSYDSYESTTNHYLQYNSHPLPDNIWRTRVLVHIFKKEVIDIYGWEAFTDTFKSLAQQGYPMKTYNYDHTWGGFLYYLGKQTNLNLNLIFANYGLPLLQWYEEDGYVRGMKRINMSEYSFRVRCFDREGDQPTSVLLHTYSSSRPRLMCSTRFIGGNNETGWVYERNRTFTQSELDDYAFGANDGSHSVFQAVGLPTLRVPVESPYAEDLDNDLKVDMRDIGLTALSLGSHPGHSRWNPICNIYEDDRVDMKDLILIAKNFGKAFF